MNMFKRSLLVIFHPSEAFIAIKKERGHTNMRPLFVMLFLAVAVRVVSIFIEHFPLAQILPRDANIWLEIVRIVLPTLLVIASCYLVTTIMDGGATIREMLVAGSYCLLPYIILCLPLTLFSHLIDANSVGFYGTLHTIVWIWVGLLFFTSVRDMNEYDFGETVLILVLTALTVAIIVALALMFFALTSQIFDFGTTLLLEIRLLLLG
ncbi:MAG: YIP1 family protein [Clostridia bacterium]|nr:YIP1 family protein [Clostridia bacterium]